MRPSSDSVRSPFGRVVWGGLAAMLLVSLIAGCSTAQDVPTGPSEPDSGGVRGDADLRAVAYALQDVAIGWLGHPFPDAEIRVLPADGWCFVAVLDLDDEGMLVDPVRISHEPAEVEASDANGGAEQYMELRIENAYRDELGLPLAEDFVAVLWGVGDLFASPGLGRPDTAAYWMTDAAGLREAYSTDHLLRESLAGMGAMLIVSDGRAVSLIQNYSP